MPKKILKAPCGIEITRDIKRYNKSELDWCRHNCDIGVWDCEYWRSLEPLEPFPVS